MRCSTARRTDWKSLQLNLEETIAGIEDTRNAWTELVRVVGELKEKTQAAEERLPLRRTGLQQLHGELQRIQPAGDPPA